MFTLEIYEQVTGKTCDMVSKLQELERSTVKEKLAESEESIKVASADKAGVEIFFAPDDTISDDVKKEYPEIKPTTKKQSCR